jgi:hypothetical protein
MAISLCKLKSFEIQKGERILKVEQIGIKTADFATSFGDDSVPPKNWTAVYCDTLNDGDKVIVGWINSNQLTKVKSGEKRLFSLKENGKDQSIEIYLRNDEKIEIGGNQDNLVRYSKLNLGLQSEKNSINIELQKIATAISTLGGSYIYQPISVDISDSKIDQLLSP